jgi:hypothetical protein
MSDTLDSQKHPRIRYCSFSSYIDSSRTAYSGTRRFSRKSHPTWFFTPADLQKESRSVGSRKVTTFSFFWKEKQSIFVDLKVFFALVNKATWYRQWTCSNFFDKYIRSQDMNFCNLDFSPVQARRFSLFKLLFKQEKSRFSGHFFGKMWLFFDKSACLRPYAHSTIKRIGLCGLHNYHT